MPRVVPSQVVEAIDKLFPWAKSQNEGNRVVLQQRDAIRLAALFDLVEQIPAELLIMDSRKYAELVASIAAIRTSIAIWQNLGVSADNYRIFDIEGLRRFSPVALIRQALVDCPDEFPVSGTSELNFIPDNDFRESLRRDISTVNSALSNGEWKAATVLAGSVIEALLLWALQRHTSGAKAAFLKLGLKGVAADLEKWDLHAYIEVAADLKTIKPETTTQCRLAKDFRNLIHPGRAQRLGQECNRATALSVVAALEHVVNDLTP